MVSFCIGPYVPDWVLNVEVKIVWRIDTHKIYNQEFWDHFSALLWNASVCMSAVLVTGLIPWTTSPVLQIGNSSNCHAML